MANETSQTEGPGFNGSGGFSVPSPTKSGGHWSARATVAVAIGLVAIPLIWTAIPSEIARWHQAAAVESVWNEDYEAALSALDRALLKAPGHSGYQVQRAAVLIHLKRFDEAIEVCTTVLELGPDPSALYYRATAQQRKGQHRKGLDDLEELVDLTADQRQVFIIRDDGRYFRQDYEDALNTRAYARALANVEIDAALDDINTAFERMGREDISAYLDTRGYLHYLAGDYKESLQDMERAVELAESEWPAERFEQLSADEDGGAMMARMGREGLSVLYYHRALALDALGRKEDAVADFDRADAYGYSPEDGVW